MMHHSLALFASLFLFTGTPGAQPQVLFDADFEADDGGFTGAFTNDWEHGAPTSGPGVARSGTQCWATNLSGTGAGGFLLSPLIDTTAAAGSDGLLLTWWQYLEAVPQFGYYYAYVKVSNPSHDVVQSVFGSRLETSEAPYPAGWQQMAVRLGPELAVPDLQIEFHFEGGLSDGWYVDDVRIETLHTVTVESEDFELADGGFTGEPLWGRGTPQNCFSFPNSGHIPAGSLWGTGLIDCSYPDDSNSSLVSPTLDLTPWANRREVYLLWRRMVETEAIGDGVHHEISFDGGTTWESSLGDHSRAYTTTSMVGFGQRFDPALTPSVKLRFRMKSDGIETEAGAWIDDFEIAVPERVLGSGSNPQDSLFVSSGAFELGSSVQLAIDDPGASFPPGSIGLLSISLGPDSGLPNGTPIPGWGMAAPGSSGDYLIDFTGIVFSKFTSFWSPGTPSVLNLAIPNDPLFADIELWLQGALIDFSAPTARVGLTTGLFERISS